MLMPNLQKVIDILTAENADVGFLHKRITSEIYTFDSAGEMCVFDADRLEEVAASALITDTSSVITLEEVIAIGCDKEEVEDTIALAITLGPATVRELIIAKHDDWKYLSDFVMAARSWMLK